MLRFPTLHTGGGGVYQTAMNNNCTGTRNNVGANCWLHCGCTEPGHDRSGLSIKMARVQYERWQYERATRDGTSGLGGTADGDNTVTTGGGDDPSTTRPPHHHHTPPPFGPA